MERLGIVGFPNSGKTTLFNALTGLNAATAPHAYTTVEPNIGVARVPDVRLEQIAVIEGSAKVTQATIELIDLPAWSRAGIGGQFLGRLRAVEALAVVLREDPLGQAEELLLELTVADHDVFAKKHEQLVKEAAADKAKARASLRSVVPPQDVVVVISAKLEEEGAQLPEAERAELFAGLGLGEGALATMVRATYQSLGLISFYTVGPKESRAWTVRAGALAPEAAGKIHSDLERGFIRAEVASIDDVIAAGGWDAAKRAGLVRVEGKSYEVAGADVLLIRFSV
ncbi:MAG: DUF933 domain-containing protein [Actinobacteria bacterium]|nr:DUF933 domain-containing protein [Actinomycetota bacterium]